MQSADQTAQEVRRLKDEGSTDMSFPLFRGTPLPYQAAGAHIAYITKRLLLMDPTGLGKTIQAILLASKLIEEQQQGKRKTARIFIAVESATLLQWVDEIKLFLNLDAHTPLGEKHSRLKKYNNLASRDTSIVVVNHAKMLVDFDTITNIYKPDVIIIDEADIIANINKTHQHAKWLTRRVQYILLMTAEPITRGDLLQIYNLFQVMHIQLCDSEEDFIDQFVVMDNKHVWVRGKFGPFKRIIKTPVGVRNVQSFKKLISLNALRRPESILGERRIINRQLISVEMTQFQRERYEEIKKKILTNRGEKQEINAISSAHYLSQILCSPWLVDDHAKQDSPKAEALVKLVDRIHKEKIVVFSRWKKMHKILDKHFKDAGINATLYSGDVESAERYKLIRDFKEDPDKKVLVMTEAGKKGLNLQVSRNIVLLDLLYSPAAMRQLIGRVDRIGQTHNVINLFFICANGSTEMNIMKVLKDRQGMTDAIFDENRAPLFSDSFSPEEMLLNFS